MIFALLTESLQACEVYTWKDEFGQQHFSDKPRVWMDETERDMDTEPEAKKVFELQNIDEGYPTGAVADPYREQVEASERERESKIKKRKLAQCKRATDMLRVLSGPVTFQNNGEDIYVSESERRKIQSEMEEAIRRHCG